MATRRSKEDRIHAIPYDEIAHLNMEVTLNSCIDEVLDMQNAENWVAHQHLIIRLDLVDLLPPQVVDTDCNLEEKLDEFDSLPRVEAHPKYYVETSTHKVLLLYSDYSRDVVTVSRDYYSLFWKATNGQVSCRIADERSCIQMCLGNEIIGYIMPMKYEDKKDLIFL